MLNEDRPMNRRRFFREGLRELLKPLAGAIEPLAEAAKQLEALERQSTPAPTPAPSYAYEPPPADTAWVRPPGAMSEYEFLSMCSRSGECVRACPVQAIQMDYSANKGNGAPYIEVEVAPCVVCESLACMTACPTGALQQIPRAEIRMGTAAWKPEHCLRTMAQECSICVDKCPMGSSAIQLVDGRIEVVVTGCVGCGVCQHECPTQPKSIVVNPPFQAS